MWIWTVSYLYNYPFISYDCNPGRREQEMNKSLDINVSAGSLSLQKWHSSFHHRTFIQNLSHTSKPICSSPSLFSGPPSFVVNSCLENQNSRQVAYKKSTDFSKMLQLQQNTLFNWFWGLLLSLYNRELSNYNKKLSNFITAVGRIQ